MSQSVSEVESVCTISEEQLWSWIDRDADELSAHLGQCARCRDLATQIRSGMEAVSQVSHLTSPAVPSHIGSYEVIRQIGEGGQGLVYEAQQAAPSRRVALKVIRGGRFVDEQNLRLFQREVATLARLRHPAIASIFEAGTTQEGQHFFAMELVDGVPITRFAREGRLGLPRRLRLFREACLAIHYAHQRGVIHRDIKPTNILVDPGGSPKILDFGLARVVDEDLGVGHTITGAGKVQGTLPYMSPEQAAGRSDEIDVRCDVYALGVVLYELLTGRLPFDIKARLPHEAVRQICEETPPRPSSINRALRGDLDWVILRAMAKSPSQRYQSARELADDIERYLMSEPILARPPSPGYQLGKLVRRHKVSFAFAAAVFLLLGASAIWVSLLYSEAAREADKAKLINRFLQSMLASYDPYNPRGQTATVSEVLKEAARRVDSDLTMTPEIEVAIRETIGNTYLSLGRYQEAESHLWRVLQFRETQLEADDPLLASSRHNMARLLAAKGDFTSAEPLFTEALRRRRQRFGDEHPLVADTLYHLAEVLHQRSSGDDPEWIMRSALRIRRAALGPDHLDIAESLQGLGVVLMDTDQFEEAELRLNQSLQMRHRLVGPDHPYVADTLNDLARVHARMGLLETAEQDAREALRLREQKLSPQHPDMAESLLTLGLVLSKRDRQDAAETSLRDALQLRLALLPADHFLVGETRLELGRCLLRKDDLDAGEKELLSGWEILVNVHGRGSWRTRDAAGVLAELYRRAGQPQQEIRWSRIARAGSPESDPGPDELTPSTAGEGEEGS